jgi:integral membrane protein
VVLLTIAMPLKYLADRPEAVRVVGSLHGGLFMLFMLALLLVGLERRWSIARMVWATILASIPLGAFYFERQLRSEEPEPTQG